MIRNISLSIFISIIVILAAACGGAAEPDTADGGAASGQKATEAPAPTTSTAITAAASTPEAAMADSGSGNDTTPAPASTTGTADAITVDGQTFEIDDLMAQALGSPELLSCLTSKMGMSELLQLAVRAPTDEEAALLLPCLTDGPEAGESTSDAGSAAPSATATPTPAPQTILAQALVSPGLMWCVAGNVGMDIVVELESRAPTSGERRLERRVAETDRRRLHSVDLRNRAGE